MSSSWIVRRHVFNIYLVICAVCVCVCVYVYAIINISTYVWKSTLGMSYMYQNAWSINTQLFEHYRNVNKLKFRHTTYTQTTCDALNTLHIYLRYILNVLIMCISWQVVLYGAMVWWRGHNTIVCCYSAAQHLACVYVRARSYYKKEKKSFFNCFALKWPGKFFYRSLSDHIIMWFILVSKQSGKFLSN